MSISPEAGRHRLVHSDIGSQMDLQCKVVLNHLSEAPKEAETRFLDLVLCVCSFTVIHRGIWFERKWIPGVSGFTLPTLLITSPHEQGT